MNKPTILVVDDKAFFRRLFGDLLSGAGYAVESVSSGEEALARMRRGGIEVVVADLVMPGLGGLELLSEARGMESPPDVILVTGYATLETAIQALNLGARGYLLKPVKSEELLHLVRTSVDQRRILDENLLLKSEIRLFQAGRALSSMLELDRLIPQAIRTLLREAGEGRAFAYLLENEKDPEFPVLEGVEETEALALVRSLEALGKPSQEVRTFTGQELVPAQGWPEEVVSLCFFPVCSQDGIKGALVLINPPTGDFSKPLPQRNLRFLYEQAAYGFANAYRYQDARDLMFTDDLTGLHNQRYFDMALEQEVRRSERYGFEFSLVFIDLDFFKEVNDTFGHVVGSQTLKEVAELLRLGVRATDILFRYGGDEFTALLVETGRQGAALVAERVRRSIEEHLFSFGAEVSFRLTATVGYATFPEDAADKDQIVDVADRAMYFGKKVRNVSRGASEVE